MKYREFLNWCNQRACDGCWSFGTATFCINLINKIKKKPFWKREKYWKEHEEFVVKNVVNVINKKIQDLKVKEEI